MSICKDCIHYDICDPYVAPNESFPEVEGSCRCFKDKTEKNGLILKVNGVTGYFPKEFIVEAIETHMSVVRCKDCEFNVANMEIDENDGTDYSGEDIVCSYFMTDGMEENDYCSRGKRREGCL